MEWVEQEMATAALGDERLHQRLRRVLERCFAQPLASLKAAMRGHAEMIAAYRFFDHEAVTPQSILAPHRAATLERVKAQRRVLLIQDTTEIDYTRKPQLHGAGPLSIAERRGFFAHTQYAVSSEGLPLGVWQSAISARTLEPGRSAKEKERERKQRPPEERESYRWIEGYREACALAERAPGVQIISQADREGDLYDLFLEWQRRLEQGRAAADWLIRASHLGRKVQTPPQPLAFLAPRAELSAGPAEAALEESSLLKRLQKSPLLGVRTFQVKKRVHQKKIKGSRKKVVCPERIVTLEVRAAKVELRPPAGRAKELPPVSVWVVLAQETEPPSQPAEDPICWVLLTSLEVNGLAAASEILDLYLVRWEIEVFHRVLKSGCRIEELQLKEESRVRPAIALYMIVAWRVLYLMKLGRGCPELPCDVVFETDEWQAIVVLVKGRAAPLDQPPTLGEMVRMVASFGGFVGRKGDGHPGAESMWIGLTRLRDFALCWQSFGRGH